MSVAIGVAALGGIQRQADACSGTPVGPAGIALSCAHPDRETLHADDEVPPDLRVGGQIGWTAIRHQLGQRGELRRRTLAANIAWRALDSITLLGDVGAVLGGDITEGDDRYTVEPGMRGGLGITWRAYEGDDWLPFILFGASLSVLSSTTERLEKHTRLTALDFRASMVVGKLFASRGFPGRIGPYLVGRTITGALYWKLDGRVRSVQPSDAYQLGLGVSTSAGDWDGFAEVCPLGERSAVVGLGYAF